jgi:hypothetical protein
VIKYSIGILTLFVGIYGLCLYVQNAKAAKGHGISDSNDTSSPTPANAIKEGAYRQSDSLKARLVTMDSGKFFPHDIDDYDLIRLDHFTEILDPINLERLQRAGVDFCHLCNSAWEDGEMAICMPGCGHCYHEKCSYSWIKKKWTCPVCKKGVKKQLVNEYHGDILANSLPAHTERVTEHTKSSIKSAIHVDTETPKASI